MSIIDDELIAYLDNLSGDFILADVAAKFLVDMQAQYPEHLAQWVDERAVDFVHATLRRMLHSQRSRANHAKRTSVFRSMADDLAVNPDDPDRIDVFRQAYVVSHEHLWRHLRDLTKTDLGFIAEQYEARGHRMLMRAAYVRQLEAMVGPDQVLGDVISEEQLVRLQDEFAE
jgi:hypothetical protein